MPNTCVNYEKKCGGCPLLALPYREQLAKKQARLQELLGGFAPVKAVQGMAEPLHYRNKAIASFATQRGKLVCGLYAEGTHRVLPGADCLLQEEILNKTLAAVLDAARACRWTAYDEDRGTGLLRHTVLRSSGDGKVLVTLVTPGPDLPGSKNFCTALHKKAPWVVSIVQNINPTRSSAVLGSREKTLYGPGFVLDTLCGTQFAISSRSFYQVNRTQTEVLYKKALELAKLTGRETVIDAYCGIGTIGLCAAPLVKQVIGVERNPAAVKDAAANARRNKIANARFVCADATEWMAAAAGEGLHPDVVFLDPPRAGSTPECIAAVNKMKPRRVVYVSCDPETLARDVAAFTRLGWRAAKFCPVDLFPQTKHVEKRLGFQKMIADAVGGKIDLILTKSISRFGRNIVDILDNLRTLSALNPPVSVEFETEGITYTGDGRNNLLISLLAALAEMESQQKSEAIKAGIRWRMAEGIYKFSVQNTLGFYRDHFGRLVIEPTEARIVEYIYESCLEGATPAEIAAALTEQGIKSPMGNDLWSAGTVRSILRNEKYCGDALMQKTYTKDFRTHKSVKNTDLNMYFKENHHTAIIKKEDWIKVQKLLSERHSTAKRATLRRLSNHFVAYRVKDGLFKGYLIMDSRWSFMERQEFMKIVDETQNTIK